MSDRGQRLTVLQRNCLVAIRLSDGDPNGEAIHAALDGPALRSVYDALNALADRGYAASERDGMSKRWRVTDDGLQVLGELAERYERALAEVSEDV